MRRSRVLLLTLLVAGLAAAGTWYVMAEQAKKDKAALQKQIDELKAEMEEGETTTLEIKEWGVKMSLSSEIRDLEYKLESSAEARLSATSLKDEPGCGDDLGSLGMITRNTSQSGAGGSEIVRQVGNYYYHYFPSQNPCEGVAEKPALREAVERAFRTLAGSVTDESR